MRHHDLGGPGARAWRLDMEHGARRTPDHAAGVDVGLVNGPFHPMWSWWYVSVVSLRDIEGVPPANRHYPGAEYEFLIASIDPDYTVDVDAIEAGSAQPVPFLRPIDCVVQ